MASGPKFLMGVPQGLLLYLTPGTLRLDDIMDTITGPGIKRTPIPVSLGQSTSLGDAYIVYLLHRDAVTVGKSKDNNLH